MSLTDRLSEYLSSHTDESEQINSIKIELVDVDVAIATVNIVTELDESVQNPSTAKEAEEYSNAIRNSRTEEVHIREPDLIESIHRVISDFETKWNVREEVSQDAITIHPTRIVYSNSWGVTARFDIESTNMDWVEEFGPIVTDATQMIDTTESLRSMNVRIMSGGWFKPFDYTIYFATDTPQKYWDGCDTLRDYAEMVSDLDSEVTVEDVLNQDEYESHTHLMNQQDSVDEWFRDFIHETLDEHIESSDAVTVQANQFNTDFDTFEISGVISREL